MSTFFQKKQQKTILSTPKADWQFIIILKQTLYYFNYIIHLKQILILYTT